MEAPWLLPGASTVLMVKRSLAHRRTLRPPSSAPVRILGPCKSARMPMGFSRRPEVARTSAIARPCSSCVPCEKLSRATSIPARINWSMIAGVRLAGPRVQTILARRSCAFQLFCDEFMNHLVEEIDPGAEACDGNPFVVPMHPQEIRLAQRKRDQTQRLHIVDAQIRGVRVPGAQIGNHRGAGKFFGGQPLDGLVKLGSDRRGRRAR